MRRLLAVVIAAGAVGCGSETDATDWTPAKRAPLVIGVDVVGSLKAADQDVIAPPSVLYAWRFKIASMAPEGEPVEKGATLVRFDTTDLEQRLLRYKTDAKAAAEELTKYRAEASLRRRDAELALAEARGKMRKAKLKADRPAELTSSIELKVAARDLELANLEVGHLEAKGSTSAKTDELAMASLKRQQQRAESRIEELSKSIAAMSVTANRAGTVIHGKDHNGDKRKVGETVWRGNAIMEVASLDRMEATGDVDEVDSSRVAVGQVVSIRLEAHPERELAGTIAKVAETVGRKAPDNPQKAIRVDIRLESVDDLKLLPGMRYRGNIEVERADNALLVPHTAVQVGADGPTVRRRRAGVDEVVRVELGRRNADLVEVLSGLSDGDEVARIGGGG